MSWFTRNILLVHLFALLLAFSWIHGGTRADLLMPVIPWLTLFVLEWLLVFPQAKSSETLFEARSRVWCSLKHDPLLYVAVALTILLVIPLFNVARPPAYDETLQQWRNFKPPVDWLPFCVDPLEHAVLLLWFPPVLIAALATRHGLLKKSKRILLEGMCWNGGALACVGFAQLISGTTKLLWRTQMESYFFSAFGYPNLAGAFFTLLAALALGLWFQSVTEKMKEPFSGSKTFSEEESWFTVNRMLLPALLSFAGAIASLSRAAILLSVLVWVVLITYMLFYVWKYVSAGVRVTILASLFAVGVVIVVSLLVFKVDTLKKELRAITLSAVVDRVTGKSFYHGRIAKEIFIEHPVFGVGGWGYPHYQLQHLTPEDKNRMQIEGGSNVHNDTLQFLAEQGIVGYSLIVLCALLLIFPVFWQAERVCKAQMLIASNRDAPDKGFGWLQTFPVPLVSVSVGAIATVCHSLGDLPFRAPSVMLVWVLAWSCVPGWMPGIRKTLKSVAT